MTRFTPPFLAIALMMSTASPAPAWNSIGHMVVSKLAYRLHPPRRGDIIVFDAPPSAQAWITFRQTSTSGW